MDMDRATGLDCHVPVDTCSLYWRILNWIMLMGRGIVSYFLLALQSDLGLSAYNI